MPTLPTFSLEQRSTRSTWQLRNVQTLDEPQFASCPVCGVKKTHGWRCGEQLDLTSVHQTDEVPTITKRFFRPEVGQYRHSHSLRWTVRVSFVFIRELLWYSDHIQLLFLRSCSLGSSFLLGTHHLCQKQTASRSGIRVPMVSTDIRKWHLRHPTCPTSNYDFPKASAVVVGWFHISRYPRSSQHILMLGIFEWLWSSNRSVRKVLDFCMPLEFPCLAPSLRRVGGRHGPAAAGTGRIQGTSVSARTLRLTLNGIDGTAIGPASVHDMKDPNED